VTLLTTGGPSTRRKLTRTSRFAWPSHALLAVFCQTENADASPLLQPRPAAGKNGGENHHIAKGDEVDVLGLILPVFAVMVTGYVFVRLGFLSEDVSGVLIQFVYRVSIPALMFVIIAQEEIETLLDWPFIIAFGGVTAVIFVVIFFGAIYWRRMTVPSSTMLATISVGSNTGIIALPLMHSLFGQKAAVLAAIANLLIVIVFLVQIFLLEAFDIKDASRKSSTLAHVKNAILNPVILSTLLGVAYAITPFSLPKLVTDYLDLVASALTPCALFAVGMSINPASVMKSGPVILFASIVKLVALPLLVFAVAQLMGLHPLLAVSAVIAAAVPTAKTEFILAKQYHQSEELVADTISFTTAVAIVTLIAWLLFLSWVYPGAFSLR
jgi:malonate transporter and related proteins